MDEKVSNSPPSDPLAALGVDLDAEARGIVSDLARSGILPSPRRVWRQMRRNRELTPEQERARQVAEAKGRVRAKERARRRRKIEGESRKKNRRKR